MSIAFRCGGCQKKYAVDDKFAGKKVRCKQCGQIMAVPGEAAVVLDEAMEVGRGRPEPETDEPDIEPVVSVRSPQRSKQKGAVADHAFAPSRPLNESRAGTRVGSSAGSVAGGSGAYPAAGGQPYKASSFPTGGGGKTRRPADAYVRIGNELALDAIFPIVTVAGYLLWALIGALVTMSNAGLGRSVGMMWISVLIRLAITFGVMAPLVMAGFMIGAKIFNFDLPGRNYLRAAAAVATGNLCLRLFPGMSIAAFSTATDLLVQALAIEVVGMLIGMWLMFRLRVLEFTVSALIALVLSIVGGIVAANIVGNALSAVMR